MSAQDDKGKSRPEPLLDDDAFAALMDHEWQKAGAPVDQMAKARVWGRLSRQVRTHKPRPWQLPALIAACFLGVLFVGRSFWPAGEDSGQQYKGTPLASEALVGFRIQANDGDLLPWDSAQRQAGDIILPYAEAKVPVAVVLLRKITDDQYELVAGPDAVIPGEEHFFSQGDETLAIQLESSPETYCLYVAKDMDTAKLVLSQLPKLGDAPDAASLDCFSL